LKIKISLGAVQHVSMGSPPLSGTQNIAEKEGKYYGWRP
jgi:hypothetical protein